MATEDHTYVIDPGATDPDLIRKLTPLGEDPGRRTTRSASSRQRRRATVERPAATQQPPSRPLLWLVGAFALGPFSLLLATPSARRIPRWRPSVAGGAGLLAGLAAWIWFLPPAALGGGDRLLLAQVLAVALAAAVWLAAWCLGLVAASRRCPEGPLSRRGHQRPLLAGLAGLAAPGLGLLLAGRRWRCVLSVILVGAGGVAALLHSRAATWWTTHRTATASTIDDLQLESFFLSLVAILAVGILAWLVSALEGGRLAAGPRVVRAVSGADRVPAALLIALVALTIWFRPLDAAHGLDRLTSTLVADGLRLAPLWTARAASSLAPGEPRLEMRVAERQAALGRHEVATAIREDLQRRWHELAVAAPGDAVGPAGAAGSPATASAPWREAAAAAMPLQVPGTATGDPRPPAR